MAKSGGCSPVLSGRGFNEARASTARRSPVPKDLPQSSLNYRNIATYRVRNVVVRKRLERVSCGHAVVTPQGHLQRLIAVCDRPPRNPASLDIKTTFGFINRRLTYVRDTHQTFAFCRCNWGNWAPPGGAFHLSHIPGNACAKISSFLFRPPFLSSEAACYWPIKSLSA